MCEVSEGYIVWVPISVLTVSKLDGVSVCNYMYVRKALLDSSIILHKNNTANPALRV